ncbi:T9SS C-terminal target domain-containing protein [Paraflavitalea soli]|uniref:T9SS C-terminal target domain-containing protein n=1 Tax=Paraflavitalea soli TaxID=2315862 RepID=A0A3B7MJ48_9BACT|nr:T9SS type A sorting domain-containing protein [Paraflavitalea soli]AXY73259.1 T9SS C-terminal target domain-containing protein [Paraflavitalea soli]
MKSIYILLLHLLLAGSLWAQQVQVGAGASVVLYPGSSFSSNGLVLTPSTTTTLSGFTIDNSTTVNHPFGPTYVTRVYQFNPTGPAFSGDIRFNYTDGELNGLTESALQVIVYNGTSWQAAGTSVNDGTLNYVDATGISNLLLGEVILANSLALPLRWGPISATRQQNTVTVRWITEQEQQVSHFDVERSTDGLHWATAIAGIAAGNQSHRREYVQSDKTDHTGALYYRIRQTDIDGRYTFSKVAMVGAWRGMDPLTVQPNPASGYFSVTGIAADEVVQTDLYTPGGALIKTWKGYQQRYTLPALAAGVYYARIHLANGQMVSRQLAVQ